MKAKRPISFSLLIAGIFLLAMTVLPHHHHHKELPCFRFWEQNHTCNDRQHNENPCENHCVAKFEKTVIAVPGNNSLTYQLSPVACLLFKEMIPDLSVHPGQTFFLLLIPYIEHLHGTLLSHCVGLRAPPFFLA